MNTKCCHLIAILLIGLLCPALASGVEPEGLPIPTLSELPKAVANRHTQNEPIRVAFFGLCPNTEDSGLSSTESFQIKRYESCDTYCCKDTQLCVWLRKAWPSVYVSTADFPRQMQHASEDEEVAEFTKRIDWLLQSNPDVILVRQEVLKSIQHNAAVTRAFANCWRQACLPILVTTDAIAKSFPGVLHVRVVPKGQVVKYDKSESFVSHREVASGLPEEALSCPTGVQLGNERAALAYIALATGTMPASGLYPHLERASIAWQFSPEVVMSQGHRVRLFIPFVANETDDETSRFHACEKAWLSKSASIASGPDFIYCKENDIQSEPEKKVVFGINVSTNWRHLDMVAQLTHMNPVFVSGDDVAARGVYQLDPKANPDYMASVLQFWVAQSEPKGGTEAMLNNVQLDSTFKGH